MKKIGHFLDGLEQGICGALLVGIVTLLFVQVIARYGMGQSISWAEEMSRFGLLALVYISAAIGARKGTHIRVTGHIKALPQPLRLVVLATADLIWITFNVIVIYQSVLLILGMNTRPLMSGALMLNMQWIFALIPLGFALQTIRLVQRWWLVLVRGEPVLGGGGG
jgi:TRAP-type C4-dicarboxylate transport system permease small subunit